MMLLKFKPIKVAIQAKLGMCYTSTTQTNQAGSTILYHIKPWQGVGYGNAPKNFWICDHVVSINSKHLPIRCKFYNNLKHLVKPQNQTLSQTCFQNLQGNGNVSQAWKQPKLQDFLTKTNTRVGLIPNQNHETKKTIIRTWQVQNNNSTIFYCKNETKTEQNNDKKKYPKLVLNKLKVLKIFAFIYSHWAPSSRPIYMWLMFTHVWTINKLKFN
jgi:hypothetical protein